MNGEPVKIGLVGIEPMDGIADLCSSNMEWKSFGADELSIDNIASCSAIVLNSALTVGDRDAIATLVFYVVNGGTVFLCETALKTDVMEIKHLSAVDIVADLPSGAVDCFMTSTNETIHQCTTVRMIPQKRVFSNLESIIDMRYSKTVFPAVWKQKWGKGTVYASVLLPELFFKDLSAAEQVVLASQR